jgi:hypothetical protein
LEALPRLASELSAWSTGRARRASSTVSSLAAAPKFPFLLTLTPTPINKLDERRQLSNLVASARQ